MTIGERIKELRLNRVPRPSQTEIGRLISNSTDGQAQAKIKRIESGKQEPTITETFALADYFHVDRYWLLTGEASSIPIPEKKPRPIPVISWVQAGAFCEASDIHAAGESGEGEPVYSIKVVSPNTFALRVEGESMMPRFMPGDIIVVDPEIKCDNGTPCVIWLNGEVTFKLFWETDTEVRLEPTNDKYPATVIKKDSRVDFRVIGKIVDIIAKL
jgi:SOS-response transcriptional repressor LexA